ncbi:MAG: DUF5110 domain-containing protein [Chthoniobacterales bacterium]|nr:DUF5110 domain-containing protein [Chthoniobacterales bacterium]
MKQSLRISLLLLGLGWTLCAAEPTRELLNHTFTDGVLRLELSDGTMRLTPYSANAIEAVFMRKDETAPSQPSYAIGRKPGPVDAKLTESADELRLETGGLDAVIRRQPFQISYRYKDRDLIGEEAGFFEHDGKSGFRFRLLSGDEKLFGGGSRALGKMNRRGEHLELYSSAPYGYGGEARSMYYSMPAVVSSEKYMLVFDNSARGWLDADSKGDGILQFEAVGGRMAYLLIASDSWARLSAKIADTTGTQPMLPRWALGHLSSRFGYRNQREVEKIAEGFTREKMPLDAMILDLYWFGPELQGYMGNLDWDRKAFPNPEAMMQKLSQRGVKTILITEPFILTASKNWKEAGEKKVLATDADGKPMVFDIFFGPAGIIDVFAPAGRDWFWEYYRKHTESGVAGWWGDLGEPETHPDDILHATGRGEDLHNAYGHEWTRLIFEGLRELQPDKRPFLLMRSGFVGTQRYGIVPWSGDVSRNWGGLKSQIEITLQMGLQGVPYMHSDLGGFTGKPPDPELYVRWLQFGTFQPIYRPHGNEDAPVEPSLQDKKTKDIVRRYLDLRYRLLPYNYTLMFENSTTGIPLMRPLAFLDDRPEMADRMDAYLWGDAFLVAPILENKAAEREVPLPEGSVWFDYWNGDRHEGGQTITTPVTVQDIPVFVKAGSFIPMIDPIPTTAKYDPKSLQVHFYADPSVKESTGSLYDDDGETFDAHGKKKYELLQFRSLRPDDGTLELHLDGERHTYDGMPENRTIRYVIHALGAKPQSVSVDGRPIPVTDGPSKNPAASAVWNKNDRTLSVTIDWSGTPRTVKIGRPA